MIFQVTCSFAPKFNVILHTGPSAFTKCRLSVLKKEAPLKVELQVIKLLAGYSFIFRH